MSNRATFSITDETGTHSHGINLAAFKDDKGRPLSEKRGHALFLGACGAIQRGLFRIHGPKTSFVITKQVVENQTSFKIVGHICKYVHGREDIAQTITEKPVTIEFALDVAATEEEETAA